MTCSLFRTHLNVLSGFDCWDLCFVPLLEDDGMTTFVLSLSFRTIFVSRLLREDYLGLLGRIILWVFMYKLMLRV